GELHGGWKLITAQLNHERLGLGSWSDKIFGPYKRVLDWAKARDENGHRAIDLPWVRRLLADCYTRMEAMRLINFRIAADLEKGSMDVALASATKVYGSESVIKVLRNLIEIVGHSALRRVVMGADAVGNEADPAQLDAMVALLHESILAGGIGFSSTASNSHSDHQGSPVPSRFATRDEFLRLATAAGQHDGTTLEFISSAGATFTEAEMELMADMSAAADRPLNWNVMVVNSDPSARAGRENKLSASDIAAARGGRVVGLCLPEPMRMRLCFASGFVLDMLPGIKEFIHLPHAERRAAFADAANRALIAQAVSVLPETNTLSKFGRFRIIDAQTPEVRALVGRTIGEIAAERGQSDIDTLFDIVVADDLQTGLEPPIIGADDDAWAERVRILDTDPRVIAGGSDAGAHLDMMKTFACHTSFMAEAVRGRQLMSVERAVQLFTDAPARFYGLRHRGRVTEGWIADLCVFDPATIGPGTIEPRADLPAGGWRLYSEATGIASTIVNGVEIVRDGVVTGDTPGRTIRSGRDTDTVRA
ncbi:MAG: hypothetical protein EBX39_11505, partial [Actinobacteria bacterium]|nr:hypothetical protein [Actinomycetota bacterium]